MYVILVNPDDSLYGSKKERLMQRQKLVNKLVFIVDSIYNDIDMTDATVMLEYLLPVSKKYETEILTLSEKRYNDCFLQYELPLDTKLSSEAGEIELQLTFVKNELDELFRADDSKNYCIAIHSFKSSSYSVGASKIGDLAYEMEKISRGETVIFQYDPFGNLTKKPVDGT